MDSIRGGQTVAEPIAFPEHRFLLDLFPDDYTKQCLDVLLRLDARAGLRELRRQIDAALGTLSYRERGILEMRYGLGDGQAYTLAESGYVLQLTRERIRQLQARSLRRLRAQAADLRSFVDALNTRGGMNGSQRAQN
jgi:RNA polymerase sigma factor (sigma-70 family)